MPYHAVIAVYNSAGERVKLLFEGRSQSQAAEATLSGPLLFAGLNSMSLDFPGILENGQTSVVWTGENDSGQVVGGGTYYFKIEVKDSFGKVSAYTREISVLDARPEQHVTIYNSAGERVKRIELSQAQLFTQLNLETLTHGIEQDSSGALVSGGFKMQLRGADGSASDLYWDGRNDQGLPVKPGSYSVVLVSQQGLSGSKVITRTFVVLDAGGYDPLRQSLAAPNPLKGQDRVLWISYQPMASSQSRRVTADIYTLSGERVASGSDSSGAGKLGVGLAPLSSGVYFVRVQVMQGPQVEKSKVLKISVVR